jgi:CrcB protein
VSPGVALGVTIAGGLGSLARYALATAFAPRTARWPWATLTVNVLGALAIGVVVALAAARPDSDRVRTIIATGFLGGFTTFSTLALESVQLIERRAWATAAAYVTITVVVGLAACAAGLWLGSVARR